MRLTPKDKKVIQAFYEQTSAESKKLYTDGKVLDGLWMGGNAIAEWEGGKIKFNDLGSKASVTVQRAVKKYVPANYLKLSSTRRSASEVIRSLENRVARLERQASNFKFNTMYYSSELQVNFYPLRKLKNGKVQGVQMGYRGKPKMMSHLDSDFRLLGMREDTEISSKDEKKILDYVNSRTASNNGVANIIVQQLGGSRKLQMMIGLRQILTERNAVTLVFPKPKHKGAVNRVRITLNGMDLYDMEFIRTHGRSVKVVKEFNDVYAEDLKDRFEDGTGLYIRF